MGKIDFDDLQGERRYNGMKAYSQSKLANILFAYELARRLKGTGVTANCVHPGVVRTSWAQNSNGMFGFAVKLAHPFMLSPEQGAQTSLYAATSPDIEGVTGKYFVKSRPSASPPLSYDAALAARLWEQSEKWTGIS
jgi:NAD(P)-dependent dehydrogenase (short-subunit alcohol dehydrogenase family)